MHNISRLISSSENNTNIIRGTHCTLEVGFIKEAIEDGEAGGWCAWIRVHGRKANDADGELLGTLEYETQPDLLGAIEGLDDMVEFYLNHKNDWNHTNESES